MTDPLPQFVPLTEGARLGSFRLIQRLGQGAQATVFSAHDESAGNVVALKILTHPERARPESLERLRREVLSARGVRHPGIARVLALGQFGGWHFLVEELVEGTSLADWIAQGTSVESRPDCYDRRSAEIIRDVALALGAAHEHGVVHRDIKPENILLTPDGQPKVVDFGLAKIWDEPTLTDTNAIVGTPAYMSPEQLRVGHGSIDALSDQFSLGVTFYEMLTGERAFRGETSQQVAHQVVLYEPPPAHERVAGLPEALSTICGKAMEKQRDRRYRSMNALASDLTLFLEERPIVARPPGYGRLLVKWAQTHPILATAAAVGSVALIVVTLLSTLVLSEKRAVQVREAELESALSFIQNAYETIDPRGDASAASVLDQTAKLASVQSSLPRGVQVRLLTLLGGMYRKWAQFSKAEALLIQAQTLAEQGFGAQDERTLRAAMALAEVRHQLGLRGKPDEDLPFVASAASSLLAQAAAAGGSDDELVLSAHGLLGEIYRDVGRLDDAEEQLLLSYEGYCNSSEFGPQSWEATTAANVLGRFYLTEREDLEAAEPLIEAAVDFARQHAGNTEFTTNFRLAALARLRKEQGRDVEAESLYRESLDGMRRLLGDSHPHTIATIRNLSIHLGQVAERTENLSLLEEATELSREAFNLSVGRGDDPREVRKTLLSFANMLRKLSRWEEALARFSELRDRSAGDDLSESWLQANYGAARCLQALGRTAEARPLATEALRVAIATRASTKTLNNCHALMDELTR